MTKRPETTAYNPRENHFLKNNGDTKKDAVTDNKINEIRDTKTQKDFVSPKPDFIKPKQSEISYTRTVSLESPQEETLGLIQKKETEVKTEEVQKQNVTETEPVKTEPIKEEKPTEQNIETEIP